MSSIPSYTSPAGLFSSRASLIAQIRECLLTESTSVAVIHGMAIDYLSQAAVECPHFQAISSSVLNGYHEEGGHFISADTLWAYKQLGNQLGILRGDEKGVDVLGIVKSWFEETKGWVLVFKGVEKIEALSALFPSVKKGQDLVITSRDPSVEKRLTEQNFLVEESTEVLTDLTGLDAVASSELGEQLGFEPLALFLAGAYLKQAKGEVQAYLGLIKKELARLKEDADTEFCPAAVKAAFNVTFRKLPFTTAKVEEVFYLSGYLPPDMPKALFKDGSRAIRLLEGFGLLASNPNSINCSVHPFIQPLIRAKQNPIEAKKTLKTLEGRLDTKVILPGQKEAVWRRVALHLNKLGVSFYIANKYQEADECFQSSLELRKAIYGANHRTCAESLYNLGVVYRSQKRFPDSINLITQSYQIRNAVCQPGELQASESLHTLGVTYGINEDFKHAVKNIKRALEISEKIWGGPHPNVADILKNLGVAYANNGQVALALEPLQRAVGICKTYYGDKHSKVADMLTELGKAYHVGKIFDKAMQSFYESWEIQIGGVKKEDEKAVSSLLMLMELFLSCSSAHKATLLNFEACDRDMAFFDKSIQFLRTVGKERSLMMAYFLFELGFNYFLKNDFLKSRPLWEEASVIFKALGKDVLSKMMEEDLAALCQFLGDPSAGSFLLPYAFI